MGRLLHRVRADEDGATTPEFVIIFPMFFATILTFFEAGWLMVQSAMLERGVEVAVRDLRVGATTNPTPNFIRSEICRSASILTDCNNALMIELTPIGNSSDIPNDNADCVDRNAPQANPLNPQDDYNPGVRNEVMFMRVCYVVDPWFPGIGLGLQLPKDASGGVRMQSMTAFVNEPE